MAMARGLPYVVELLFAGGGGVDVGSGLAVEQCLEAGILGNRLTFTSQVSSVRMMSPSARWARCGVHNPHLDSFRTRGDELRDGALIAGRCEQAGLQWPGR